MSLWLLPSAVAVVVLAGFSVFLFVRRPPPCLWPVAFLCQAAALVWISGDLLTNFATDTAQKQMALVVLFTGSLPLPSLWWITAVRYVRSHHLPWPWIQSRWVMLPTLVGVLGWLTMITNPLHGRFLTPVVGGRSEYHLAGHLIILASYGLVLGASALFLGLSRHEVSRDVRRSSLILAFAVLAPLTANSVYFYSSSDIPIDPACIGLGAACGAMIWGVYRTGLFSLLPVALPEVLRHDPNGVLLVGQSGRLLHWNPAAERILAGVQLAPELDFFRLLLSELRGAADLAPVADEPAHLARLLRETPEGSQGHVYRLASSERWVRISTAPVPTRRGQLAALSVRIEDVTELQRVEQERRALEEEVRHAEKLKSLGLLAGGVAHDFNNLLGSILANASLALHGPSLDPAVRDRLDEIEAAAKQAADLTLQLQAYGGNAPSSPRRVDLSLLVTKMARLLEVSVCGRATLQLQLEAGLAAVDADPAQLRQIVMNLITNAAEAVAESGGDGRVTLRTRCVEVLDPADLRLAGGEIEPGRHVVLEVSDSGAGMSEDTRSRIFDPFFTTKSEGRGLGMAVVFGSVRSLGGGIEIESERGVGTTLRVYIPEAPVRERSAEERKRPERGDQHPWRGSGTVLVVDDQPQMLRAVEAILSRFGFDVLTAESGQEAIDRFRLGSGRIGLVILDLTIPEVSGEEVLREIRRIDPDAPVIVSSGFAESQVMARLESSKLTGFLQKPYPMDDLLAAVRRVLEAPERSGLD